MATVRRRGDATLGNMPVTESDGERLLYTAKTRTKGGRERGIARSCDGRLDIKLSLPGASGFGTNPEQLFAAGWSASLGSAIADAATGRQIKLPADVVVDAEIDLIMGEEGYRLCARFAVSIAGVDRETGRALLEEAAERCPYSKATQGAVDVAIDLETP